MKRYTSSPWLRTILILMSILVLSACVQTKTHRSESKFVRPSGSVDVLLMPPDVELFELTVGGLLKPMAEWSETGRRNVIAALEDNLSGRDATLVPYASESDAGLDFKSEHVQLVKLHDAVGGTIILHTLAETTALPTKKTFDWSLGSGARVLADEYNADYALFVTMRDSFASGGRAALIVFGAILGVGIRGGSQYGFASLVDLRTGEIVWFNQLASGTGDLRKPESAQGACRQLLTEFPL